MLDALQDVGGGGALLQRKLPAPKAKLQPTGFHWFLPESEAQEIVTKIQQEKALLLEQIEQKSFHSISFHEAVDY